MRAFTCPDCRRLVVFESLDCLHSETPLAFDWAAREILALREGNPCANRELIGCNGLAGPTGVCASCALTRTGPREGDGRDRFAKAEAAKAQEKKALLFIDHFLGMYKSVSVPSKASAAKATVSDNVGCG